MKDVTAPVVDLRDELNLVELGEFIRQAGCFFGVDSVPMHMAAAAGTPLVALFGPTHQGIWAPKGPGATVLSSGTRECLPCMKHGCGNSGYSECLEDVTVDRALAEVISRFHSRR
jgi:ADP-heptose:LPS heptosyltransferase